MNKFTIVKHHLIFGKVKRAVFHLLSVGGNLKVARYRLTFSPFFFKNAIEVINFFHNAISLTTPTVFSSVIQSEEVGCIFVGVSQQRLKFVANLFELCSAMPSKLRLVTCIYFSDFQGNDSASKCILFRLQFSKDRVGEMCPGDA